MVVNGRGGPSDPVRAVALFRQAAASGNAAAKFALGVLATGRYGQTVDFTAAREWFLSAAQQGHIHAQGEIGRCFAKGIGGPKDVDKARIWLQRAAAAGLAEAGKELEAIAGPEPKQDAEAENALTA